MSRVYGYMVKGRYSGVVNLGTVLFLTSQSN